MVQIKTRATATRCRGACAAIERRAPAFSPPSRDMSASSSSKNRRTKPTALNSVTAMKVTMPAVGVRDEDECVGGARERRQRSTIGKRASTLTRGEFETKEEQHTHTRVYLTEETLAMFRRRTRTPTDPRCAARARKQPQKIGSKGKGTRKRPGDPLPAKHRATIDGNQGLRARACCQNKQTPAKRKRKQLRTGTGLLGFCGQIP